MSGSDASVTVVLADRIRCGFPGSVKSVDSWPRVDSLARWSRRHGGEGHDLRVRRGGRAGTFLWRRLQLRHGNTAVADAYGSERAPTASCGAGRVRREPEAEASATAVRPGISMAPKH